LKAISWKRYKIGGKLVLITNRKSYIRFRMVPKLVTLNDLERRNGPYFALFHRIFVYDVVVKQLLGLLRFQNLLYMVALCNRADHYIFALWFLSFFFFSLPNLSGRRLDVYHTSTHGVALVRIQNACLKCAARRSLRIQDAKKSPFWHHRTTLSSCIFAAEACIDNRKKTC